MTQKQKGYVGLGAMLVLGVATVFGSDPLYKAIDTMTAGKTSYTAGSYVGTAQGFGGKVTATVTVSEQGLKSVQLKGDDETPELGGEALDKLAVSFAKAGSTDFDGVSGCTITSNAAKAALQQALDQATGKIEVIASLVPGTYEGTAQGFGGEVKAVVTVTDAGIEVALTGDDETPELGGEALGKLEPKFAEAGSADIDGVSGCTITSDAAKAAVKAALDQAK